MVGRRDQGRSTRVCRSSLTSMPYCQRQLSAWVAPPIPIILRPEVSLIKCKYSEVLWQGRWCLLLQSVIVICVARKVTALAVGVGLLELGEPKCVRELVELCR
jgi:hypothetical protein